MFARWAMRVVLNPVPRRNNATYLLSPYQTSPVYYTVRDWGQESSSRIGVNNRLQEQSGIGVKNRQESGSIVFKNPYYIMLLGSGGGGDDVQMDP